MSATRAPGPGSQLYIDIFMHISIQRFLFKSRAFASGFRALELSGFVATGLLENTRKLDKTLFEHASEPQRRSKSLFKHASELQTLKIAAQAMLRSHLALNIAFKEAVRRSCPLQRCTLCHLTLLHFSSCMDMHGFTLVYIYIYIYSPNSVYTVGVLAVS